MRLNFDRDRSILDEQYRQIDWMSENSLVPAALESAVRELESDLSGKSKSYIKAKTFELLLQKGQIAVLSEDIFQEKLNARGIMTNQRNRWWREASVHFADDTAKVSSALEAGVITADADFGHTTSDTDMLVNGGFAGLLARLDRAEAVHTTCNEEQCDFYESSRIAVQAMADFCLRLAEAEGISDENAAALRSIAVGAPSSMYEGMQIMIVYFYLHEYIMGTRVRTLGRLDEIFYPLYQHDLETGILTKESAFDLWRYFLNKLWTMQVPYDLPFCIGGLSSKGQELTNDLSYLIVDAYDALNIYSPKIHVRVSEKTPPAFVKRVLRCIRGGNSSFVFVNDTVGIESMMRCGVPIDEACCYVPVGCYEPGIYNLELPCTGNGHLTMPKLIEYVFTRGVDHRTGKQVGLDTGEITTYDAFIDAVKQQMAYFIDLALSYITKLEGYYMLANPDPVLSAMLPPCVEAGVDAYAGGAKYNNSSYYIHSIATLADSIAAVRKWVFREQRMTFAELGTILRSDWAGYEILRTEILADREKYGNNIDSVDEIAVEFSAYAASLVNGRPNGRGGIFKLANFTIDDCFRFGTITMATPDGRKTGDPNSKNLCAVTAMDRRGITALIQSATKMDHAAFPNGSVLDFVLHPSAVAGEDGLDAFYAVLKTYFICGGFAMHGNVFHAEDLIAAQNDPEKYRNLQVRVCGWNVYFVNLSRAEQDAFIKQAMARD